MDVNPQSTISHARKTKALLPICVTAAAPLQESWQPWNNQAQDNTHASITNNLTKQAMCISAQTVDTYNAETMMCVNCSSIG